jgi:ribonuclease HI
VTTQIYFDGAFSNKTREMYAGVVCGDEHLCRHTGVDGTSADHSEWLAAAFALEYAAEEGLKEIVMIGDSNNVIGAMSRGQRTDQKLRALRDYVEGLCAEFETVAWQKVGRDDNLAGQLIERLQKAGKLASTGLLG